MLNHLSTTEYIPWPLFLLFYFYFETRSYKIAQLSLSLLCSPGCKFQLAIFLPQPLSIWDCRPTLLCQDSDSTLTWQCYLPISVLALQLLLEPTLAVEKSDRY